MNCHVKYKRKEAMSCSPRPQWEKLVLQIPLTSFVAIGLQKPYTKTEVDESCTVGYLLTQDGEDNGYFLWVTSQQDQNT
jgi:hypothetical protein